MVTQARGSIRDGDVNGKGSGSGLDKTGVGGDVESAHRSIMEQVG